MPKLTIGMPTFDDYDGVYFSLNALRLYHPEVLDDVEFLVVDNNPKGSLSKVIREFVQRIGGAYAAFDKWSSTSVGKNLVFELASAPYVLCIDSHVLLAPGSVARLIEFFEQNEDCRDLLQGPLLLDKFNISTHFRPEWRGHMWGVWDTDERGADPDGRPFEIPMQGTGLMACRKDAWLGFSDLFRGFGGQAGYIHEKYRKAGRRTLCLPFLRWMHRFYTPGTVRYPVKVVDKFRNYVVGFRELNLDLDPVTEHFDSVIKESVMDEIIAMVDDEMDLSPSVVCLMHTHGRVPKQAACLEEAVESFHRQTYRKKKLVIINDCPGQLIKYTHPDVMVVNLSQELAPDKCYNLAADIIKADIVCVWEDTHISLPGRLAQAVRELGAQEFWQPLSSWIIDESGLLFSDRKEQYPLLGAFSHQVLDNVGGFRDCADMQLDLRRRILTSVVGTVDPVEREDCQTIIREAGPSSSEECIFMLTPRWTVDYSEMVANARETAKQA